jgi:1,4-dihydroxy-2-naphthoyl-CoA hydrolase
MTCDVNTDVVYFYVTRMVAQRPTRHDERVAERGGQKSEPLDVANLDWGALPGKFSQHLGLEITEVSDERVVGRWVAGAHLDDQAGHLNRGAHSTVIESVASIGASVWLGERGRAVGVNNNTDFIADNGNDRSFVSTATPVHRDDEQQLWQVETVNSVGVLVARGQVRLQNLEPKG